MGADTKKLRNRIKSVDSTLHLTKAMGLVASSKIRRAMLAMKRGREYEEATRTAIEPLLSCPECQKSPYMRKADGNRLCLVVIAGDRGLAGGYNANIFRLGEALSLGKEALWLPIGKKAAEYYSHRKREILTDAFSRSADVGVGDALSLGNLVCEEYMKGSFDRVVLIYTKFVSMMTQAPAYEQLLPLEIDAERGNPPEFDGDADEMLAKVVPQYVGGVIFSAMKESLASEDGARRNAMNAANKNAKEMIDSLVLKYNRARQAVITQEITEIVSGAEAL